MNDYEIEMDTFDISSLLKSLMKTGEDKTIEDVIESDESVKERTFYIYDITSTTGDDVDSFIRFWNRYDDRHRIPIKERKPIKLYINSYGGSLQSTFTAVNAIKMSKTPVYTVNIGCAYSGGFFIFISGHKRFSYPYASFLYHEGSTASGGTASQFANFATFYKKQLLQLKEIVLNNTNITEEKYEEIKREDYWMNASEALELGCADIITEEYV